MTIVETTPNNLPWRVTLVKEPLSDGSYVWGVELRWNTSGYPLPNAPEGCSIPCADRDTAENLFSSLAKKAISQHILTPELIW